MDIMNRDVRKDESGMAAVSTILGVVIATIVIVAVAIPVCSEVIKEQNLSGTTGTVVNLIPMFFGLAGLITVAYLVVS